MANPPTLFDDPPAQWHSPTSVAAARAIRPARVTLRDRVLRQLEQFGPHTDEQLQDALLMNPSTERPRRIELCELGLVTQVGEAKTRAGRRAAVWGIAR